jgi:NO-binding membrane sensor protein with MHYT domain
MFHLQRKWQARYGTHGGYYCIVGNLLSIGNYAKKSHTEKSSRRGAGEKLKMKVYTSLLHYAICNMADTNFPVYSKIPVGNRTVPNIMVAFAVPHKITFMLQ